MIPIRASRQSKSEVSLTVIIGLVALLSSCSGNVQEVMYQTEDTKSYCDLDVFAQGLEVNENMKVIGEFSFTVTEAL